MVRQCLGTVFCFCLAAMPTAAQTAGMLSFQGVLKDANGNLINGPVELEFRIFDAASGGNLVAGPFGPVGRTAEKGVVATEFGPVTPETFDGTQRWLEVKVDESPLPRLVISGAAGTPLPGGGNAAIYVDQIGNVGVGTGAPAAKLHVERHWGGPSSPEDSILTTTAHDVPNEEYKFLRAFHGASERFHVSGDGRAFFAGPGRFGRGIDVDLREQAGHYGRTALNIYASDDNESAAIWLNKPKLFLWNGMANDYASMTTREVFTGHLWITEDRPVALQVEGGSYFRRGLDIELGTRAGADGREALRINASDDNQQAVIWVNKPGIAVWSGATNDYGNIVTQETIARVVRITGADVAERFPVSESVEPGMVVVIDPEQPGRLKLARTAYDRRVAGVVSGAGGLSAGAILGNLPGSEDAPAIAMSGRVYVWADASYGPIQPGDMLTTSSTPGHAMRASDPSRSFGAVIGKAMEPLADGRGLILVLVNLH